MNTAPLGSISINRVDITRQHSAVVMLVDESPALRDWLWPNSKAHRGKATGSRFRLTVDGVTIDARRVFARPAQALPKVFLTVTTGPGDTCAAAIGRKVGRPVYEVTLARVAAGKRQGELVAKAAGTKRVTVEMEVA